LIRTPSGSRVLKELYGDDSKVWESELSAKQIFLTLKAFSNSIGKLVFLPAFSPWSQWLFMARYRRIFPPSILWCQRVQISLLCKDLLHNFISLIYPCNRSSSSILSTSDAAFQICDATSFYSKSRQRRSVALRSFRTRLSIATLIEHLSFFDFEFCCRFGFHSIE